MHRRIKCRMTHWILPAAALAAVAYAAGDARVEVFTQRVNEYVKLRETAKGKAPRMPKSATPEQMENHDKAMAAAVQTARAGAKQGDIFVAESRPLFLQILKTHFSGAANQNTREVARQGNPSREKEPGEAVPVIRVNAPYPKSSPLSSVSPMLLLQLPKLPKDIEYRFSGQTLLLLDTASNLIIDYLTGAAPGV
jgi:hypothetical protein